MPQSETIKLRRIQTKDYSPGAAGYHGLWQFARRYPLFSLQTVAAMMADPRIGFGLWLIKGPVTSHARFFVDTQNTEVKEYLVKNITRFWRNSAPRALKALEWGYSCSEVIYNQNQYNGHLDFHTLKDLHSMDCRAVSLDGAFFGANIHNVPGYKRVLLQGAKVLWHVQGREFNPWYGRSRLYGAYIPWIEAWTDGGYRDIRSLYYHKNAFEGGIIYHPPGATKESDDGSSPAGVRSHKDIARELLEKKKTGGVLVFPNLTDSQGKRQWEYVPATVTQSPVNILDYGNVLKDEIWEGMGIPPEVVKAAGTGAYAGRLVPQQAFYATLQEIVYWLISDADEQIFRPSIEREFGPGIEYEIMPFGMMENVEEDGGEDESGPESPGRNYYSDQGDIQMSAIEDAPRSKKIYLTSHSGKKVYRPQYPVVAC